MKTHKTPILISLCLLTSGCAVAPTVAIYEIENKREEKYEKQQKRIQQEAIEKERIEQLQRSEEKEIKGIIDNFTQILSKGDLKALKNYCTNTGLYQDLTTQDYTPEVLKDYYSNLFSQFQMGGIEIDGVRATVKCTIEVLENEEKLEEYFDSLDFANKVEQERINQNLWTQQDINNLRESMKVQEIKKAPKTNKDCVITLRTVEDNWRIERLTDLDNIALEPVVEQVQGQ